MSAAEIIAHYHELAKLTGRMRETALRGDWDALRYGRVLDIRTKKIEYGDPFGNGDLQARNCIAYLAEVFFGWGILDLSAFAAVEDAVA